MSDLSRRSLLPMVHAAKDSSDAGHRASEPFAAIQGSSNHEGKSLMSRREVFNSVTAIPVAASNVMLPAAALTAPAMKLCTSSADADLLALVDRWRVIDKECERTFQLMCEAEDRVDAIGAPPAPEAVFRRDSDFYVFWGYMGAQHHTGRHWYGYPEAIAYLRNYAPAEHNGEKHKQAVRARINEIISAYETWMAEETALNDACGFTAANAANERANREARTLREQMIAIPVKSFDGVLAKAEVIRSCYGNDLDEMVETLTDEMKQSGPTAKTLAWGLAVDLARIVAESTVIGSRVAQS